METKRTMTVDTEMFEVGDVLAFYLNCRGNPGGYAVRSGRLSRQGVPDV